MIAKAIGGIVGSITGVVGKGIDARKAKTEAGAKIIVAETNGGFLARNWRPCLMFSAILMIVNNYILVPYIEFFWDVDFPFLDIPEELWNLLIVATVGYAGGRSFEKIMFNQAKHKLDIQKLDKKEEIKDKNIERKARKKAEREKKREERQARRQARWNRKKK